MPPDTSRKPETQTDNKPLGYVRALWRYPVKSMAAESLDAVNLSWHGFEGDRRWAFVRDGAVRSGFPWLTIREKANMARYIPRFLKPDEPNTSPVMVRTPDGSDYDIVDPRLAAELMEGARPIKQSRGIFDTFPISLITTRTIADLQAIVGKDLKTQRFRPNILVEPIEDIAFPEDGWVASTLLIGDAAIRLDKRDQRCAVVNVDPDTSEADPSVLRTIAQKRESCTGVYGSAVKPGRITVGDPVYRDR